MNQFAGVRIEILAARNLLAADRRERRLKRARVFGSEYALDVPVDGVFERDPLALARDGGGDEAREGLCVDKPGRLDDRLLHRP